MSTLELVANVWPVVDETSMIIHRFAARAYVLTADDSKIGETLKTLANSDFMIARQFPVPKQFTIKTQHGTLEGAVTVDTFNESQSHIIEDALKALESKTPALQGIGFDSKGVGFYKKVSVPFPAEPFVAITFLIED